MNEVSLKMIERIEGLFRQAESTDHPEEAKAFTEKAQELLTKYSLSQYDLDFFGKAVQKDNIETVAIIVNDPHAKRKMALLSAVAEANNLKVVSGYARKRSDKKADAVSGYDHIGVRTISTDKPSKNYRPLYLTGFSRDVESATLIYTSLLIQAKREIALSDIDPWVNRATWISHFYVGFTVAVRQRLNAGKRASTAEVVEEAGLQGFDLLPVLVERQEQVKKEYEKTWPHLSKGRSSYLRTSTSGYGAGRAAGGRSDVGHKGIGGTYALGA